jgi:micrococcal nuclease
MRTKLRLAIAGFLLAWVLACTPTPGQPQPAPSPARPEDGQEVVIAKVFDGDTVELDDGQRVRYAGINTPERDQPYYREATQANRSLVEGKLVWMVLDVQTKDRFGRILAYIWADEQFVNLELVRQGFANSYTQPPNLRFSEELLKAEQDARAAQVGLWAPSGVPLKITELNFNAPGADHENPNGEWVQLTNEGSSAIALGGFSLKDSANHIYTFPNITLSSGRSLLIFSGQGQDTQSELFWGLSGDAVWNNDGDTAYLRDAEGQLVDVYGY